MKPDQITADAFATSWNNLPEGSIYTENQAREWFFPLTPADIIGKKVLELGCGNASLMVHVAKWNPIYLVGVDLGDSLKSALVNLEKSGYMHWELIQADLTTFSSPGFDIVYCIGVLHHLRDPKKGFEAVLNNVASGGRFHCWVYAWEGNEIIRWIVDPIRCISSRLNWRITKYLIATPLVIPYFFYTKILELLPRWNFLKNLPLYEYSLWIAEREFAFFQHVAFDQLVTPQTTYIRKETLKQWLNSNTRIIPDSIYIHMRNGNSWKFGGVVK